MCACCPASLTRPRFIIPTIELAGTPARVTPTVSVVVPCYNYAHFLPRVVESITTQTDVDVDVVIVDDASSDDSVAVATRLAASDGRIQLVTHAVNKGHIATYNDGLAEATGEYVVLISADDLLTAGALQRATSLMSAHPEVGFVFGRAIVFSDDVPEARTRARTWRVWKGLDWIELRARAGANCIRSPEVVMRTSVFREIGGNYNVGLPHSGDFEMWMRAAAVADVGFVEGADQALYRLHGQNMHARDFDIAKGAGMLNDLQHRRLAFDAVFDTALRSSPDADRLRTVAYQALAKEALHLASRAYTWGMTQNWPVAGLVSFAHEVDPQLRGLPEWRAFRRRHFAGAHLSRRNPIFVLPERIQRHAERGRTLRLERFGQ